MVISRKRQTKPERARPDESHSVGPDTDTLTLIRASFPHHDKVITRAFRENRSFRELCEDYRRCVAALHRWKKRQATEPPPRWKEYAELQVELGDEIQTWLEAVDSGSHRPGRGGR